MKTWGPDCYSRKCADCCSITCGTERQNCEIVVGLLVVQRVKIQTDGGNVWFTVSRHKATGTGADRFISLRLTGIKNTCTELD